MDVLWGSSVLVFLLGLAANRSRELSGIAKIMNGDNISTDGTHIKRGGADSPEPEQKC
jgi:hypothetical protein